jgi:ParB-like chromosome segregation protein Spo0J
MDQPTLFDPSTPDSYRAVDYGRFKVHPLLDAFPLMEGNEFDQLVASIDAQGLQEPIVLAPDGVTIVDGRNRYRACRAAGRDPTYRTLGPHYTELFIIDYIASANLVRQHLTVEEREALDPYRYAATEADWQTEHEMMD